MQYITNSISTLEDFEQGLQISLSNLIKYEFKRGRLKTNLSYQEVMDLKLRYKGYSNFRNQKKLKGMSEIEYTLYLLKDFMAEMTPTMVQIKTPEKQIPKNMFHHSGSLTLKIPAQQPKPIKISFATTLKRKV